jgi:hypothetical protein
MQALRRKPLPARRVEALTGKSELVNEDAEGRLDLQDQAP